MPLSSLILETEEIARAVPSYHWHLDRGFCEHGNYMLDKQMAYNLKVTRKVALNILKWVGEESKALSLKRSGS